MNYKQTLQLPKTKFKMKASLPSKEKVILKYWNEINLLNLIEETARGRKKFTLHDGPPYANGNIHLGNAFNKVLKDIINKSHYMMGFNIHFIPGWDCHGLPIEWKVEENYLKKGKNKLDIPIEKFRQQCRSFASKWLDIQREQFKRLGVIGHWDNPYVTMDYPNEANIALKIGEMLLNGQIYTSRKPVLWSIVEKTALAEAEVEYQEHKSTIIWLGFHVQSSKLTILKDAHIVIWTTTPWTIPANRAIAAGKNILYGVINVEELEDPEHSRITKGQKLVIAKSLLKAFCEKMAITQYKELNQITGQQIYEAKTITQHPLHKNEGYDFEVPLLIADFVTEDAGTGFVHIAPSSGLDDYILGKKAGLKISSLIDEEGRYYDHVSLFAKLKIYNNDGTPADGHFAVLDELTKSGYLLAKSFIKHSYPHSWRSKAPLVYRNTKQWFISIDKLKKEALNAIDKEITFTPLKSRNRLYSMINNRPDWCISRQRSWGIPLPIFINKKTNKPLLDREILLNTVNIFKKHGSDSWFKLNNESFLKGKYSADDFEKTKDIVDVWFESGCSFSYVLQQNKKLKYPADLYAEGSDQHRGWFQSSLLIASATDKKSPTKAILTHGFVLDDKGHKMSKSLGNVVTPDEVCEKYGADILRLWSSIMDYADDIKIGDTIVKTTVDYYRKYRNTLRWMLGNLKDEQNIENISYDNLPSLEKFMLSVVAKYDIKIKEAYKKYDHKTVHNLVYSFVNDSLSSFYFDIRKDVLYCDPINSSRRKASIWVIDAIFDILCHWLAPILSFTAEDAWLIRNPQKKSIHQETFTDIPAMWQNQDIEDSWHKIIKVRKVVLGALEKYRNKKIISSSLEACPTIFIQSKALYKLICSIEMHDICITSNIKIVNTKSNSDAFVLDDFDGVAVDINIAEGKKSERSWKISPQVGLDPEYPSLDSRDIKAIKALKTL